MQEERYPTGDWNVYVLHVSDGDNFAADNQRALELIRRLTELCSLVGYLEVDPGRGDMHVPGFMPSVGSSHKLLGFYEREADGLDGFVFAHAADDRELWPALKRFFAKDGVEAAIR